MIRERVIIRQLLFLLLTVSSAYGEVYTWTDGRGTSHYTNSMYEVPARYRAKVKVLNLGPEPKGDGTPSPQLPTQPAVSAQQPATPPVVVEQKKPGPERTRTRPIRRRSGGGEE